MAAVPARFTVRLAPLAPLFLLAGCATPLGPGYHLRKETLTVHFQPAAPGLHYDLNAEIRNVGNGPLSSVTIQVPRRLPGDSWNLASRGAKSTTAAAAKDEVMQAPLDLQPPLRRRKSRELRFGYVVPARGPAVMLEARDWFPVFRRPRGLFARGETRAGKVRLNVVVPAGYGALTAGRFRGVHVVHGGGEVEYRYELRDWDLPPFLVVGRFEQRKIRVGKTALSFWTREALTDACTRSLAVHIAGTDSFYRSIFGRVSKHRRPIPVIELPAESAPWIRKQGGDFGPVPGGLWYAVSTAELCARPERFFVAADRALAATWFGWGVEAERGAQAILGAGLQRYAALLAAESRDPGARKRMTGEWLAEYGRLRSVATPLPPSGLSEHASGDQRRMAGIQSALCLVALEERFGPGPVRKALAHLFVSMRGQQAGPNELRSAVEQETGQDLFGFFRDWLRRAEIPESFRRHHPVGKTGP